MKQNIVQDYATIESPYQVLEDPKQTVYENSMTENDVLSKNDQIYEDPGHKKEAIYSWFEKKKFRKIRKEDVRYDIADCCIEYYSAISLHNWLSYIHKLYDIGCCSNLDLVNLEWLILAYGLMVLLILYK